MKIACCGSDRTFGQTSAGLQWLHQVSRTSFIVSDGPFAPVHNAEYADYRSVACVSNFIGTLSRPVNANG